MIRKREDIRLALDTALSGASHDPALFNRIVNASKGDAPPVKRKLTLSMALVLLLVLITCTVALAVAYRGVSYFMFEKYNEPVTLDEDYLLSGLRQHYYNSEHLNVTAVDAYWDGVNFSVAYHVSPIDPMQVVRIPCDYPAHDHYLPTEDADILLQPPSFINITDDASGDITRPHSRSDNWIYEKDGSLSLVISFPLNSMSQALSISIPIFYTLTDTGDLIQSMLHCYPPTLTDPIPEHEHIWTDAICVSPKTCTICERTEGGLGDHDFRLSEEDETLFICVVCTNTITRHASVPVSISLHPGDSNNYVIVLQHRLSELGYYSGPFSGKYNDQVTAAVKAFQESQGIIVDGISNAETLKKLFP